MSNTAVMPLNDYVAACDTIREKVGSLLIVKDKAFYPTENDLTEILTAGTLKLGESYSVEYTDTSLGNYGEGGIYEVQNISVQGKDTIGLEVDNLSHPIEAGATHTIYVYQDGENIMLYVPETYVADNNGEICITLEKITGKIVSGELSEKINDVYEAGQAQGERVMWDNITNYNTISSYESRFNDWGGEYIRPPYKLKPTTKRSLYCTFNNARSVKKIEKNHFDFSQKEKGTTQQEGLYYTFFHCDSAEEIEDIGIQAEFYMARSYSNCRKLKKIECVRVDENTKYDYTFEAAESLEDVIFEGIIGQNGLNLQWSKKLTIESMRSIISRLQDKSTDTSGTVWQVTVGSTNYAKLTEADLQAIEQKGWNFI